MSSTSTRTADPMFAALALRGASSNDVYRHDDFSATETTRTVLEGQLAQRVRRRLGVPAGQKVWLKERSWEGGTDYTRECALEFIVGTGTGGDTRAVTFGSRRPGIRCTHVSITG